MIVHQMIKPGQTVYDYIPEMMLYKTCPWILYPLYRLSVHAIHAKLRLYKWLNKKNIMHTPEGCIASLKDIRRK